MDQKSFKNWDPRLALGIGAALGVLAIVVIIIVFGFGLNSDEESRVSFECESLKNQCIDFCFPDDPSCIEECKREAELCRSNQSTAALETLTDKNEALNEAHEKCADDYELCPHRCYSDFVDLITDEDGALIVLEGGMRQEAEELFQSSKVCEMGCDPAFAACEENHGH